MRLRARFSAFESGRSGEEGGIRERRHSWQQAKGGLRSHRGPGGRTKEQLYREAKRMGIKGRSKMNKGQLKAAVDRRR